MHVYIENNMKYLSIKRFCESRQIKDNVSVIHGSLYVLIGKGDYNETKIDRSFWNMQMKHQNEVV